MARKKSIKEIAEEKIEQKAEEKTGAKVLGVFVNGKLIREYSSDEYSVGLDGKRKLAAECYAQKRKGEVRKLR